MAYPTDHLRQLALNMTTEKPVFSMAAYHVLLDFAEELDRLRQLEQQVKDNYGKSHICTIEESAFPEPLPVRGGGTWTVTTVTGGAASPQSGSATYHPLVG